MKNKKWCTSCRALIIDITGLRQVIDGAMITGLLTLVDVLEQPKRKKKSRSKPTVIQHNYLHSGRKMILTQNGLSSVIFHFPDVLLPS